MKANKYWISCLLLVSILGVSSSCLGFGKNGHRIIALIAQRHLDPQVETLLLKLTEGKPLAYLSTWPDEIRSDPRWYNANAWHYISIADDETFDTVPRSKNGDVLEALSRFEKVLRDPKSTPEAQWQALAFYIHFIGDLHQPLHVGRHRDKGGNTIRMKWFGERTNLHRIWDTHLIDSQKLSYTEYVEFLDHVSDENILQWQSGTYTDWARESKALRPTIYGLGTRIKTSQQTYTYLYKARPIIEKRLLQAGIRLANQLNKIFLPHLPKDTK